MPQLTDEQRSLIGRESAPREAPYAVNEAMARFWCEMVEDANPIYFDEEYARRTWLGGTCAPPAMLFTWGMEPVWPEVKRENMISKLQLEGCTTTIAVNATQEYALPIRYGDTLSIANQIASIGEEKTTRLGTGHFVTMLDAFRNQRSEIVGTHSFTLFMYAAAPQVQGTANKEQETPEEQGTRSREHAVGATGRSPSEPDDANRTANLAPIASRNRWPSPGDRLPPISLPLTLRRAIQAVAGTRDYYPFHHDERFARENGAEGIFFNTMFLQGFAGRCATGWFGNDAFLRRLEIAMRGSNYVGRTLTAEARMTGVREADAERRLVEAEGMLSTEDGPTTGVKWTVEACVAPKQR